METDILSQRDLTQNEDVRALGICAIPTVCKRNGDDAGGMLSPATGALEDPFRRVHQKAAVVDHQQLKQQLHLLPRGWGQRKTHISGVQSDPHPRIPLSETTQIEAMGGIGETIAAQQNRPTPCK